jgi:dolichol-phosphate mannosyltransferase
MPVDVLRHQANQGLGRAIRSGLTEAARLAAADDVIVTMDADDSHPPELIGKMLETVDQGFDVVIASRFRRGSCSVGVPMLRRVMSIGASVLFRILFPTRGVRDFTCGYRAYRASELQRALRTYGDRLFEFEGFQSTVDLLLKLRKLGASFSEVPVVLRYDLKQGASKMRVIQTAMRTLRVAIGHRWED